MDQTGEHIAAGEHRHGAHQCHRRLEHHRTRGVIARRQQMGHRLHKHTAEQQHHGKSNAQHITGIENMIEHQGAKYHSSSTAPAAKNAT